MGINSIVQVDYSHLLSLNSFGQLILTFFAVKFSDKMPNTSDLIDGKGG